MDAEPKKIRMSSCVLRASSKVFEQMLTIDMKEKAEKRIEIRARSVKDVEDMMYFLCTDRLRADANALGVIRLAHCYEARRLFLRCVNRIIDTVSIDTFVETVEVFNKYEIAHGFPSHLARITSRHCKNKVISTSYRLFFGWQISVYIIARTRSEARGH